MISSDLRQAQQDKLERLFMSWPVESVFPDLDPYSQNYGQNLLLSLDRVVDRFWEQLQKKFPDQGPKVLLDNAWVIALQHPRWVALLYRAVMAAGSQEAIVEAARLLALTIEELRPSPEALAVIEARQEGLNIPPNLGSRTSLKPGLRLRYALAHNWAKGASLANLIHVVASQPNTSNYLRSRELIRAISAGHALRPPVARLTEIEFFMLPEREQAVVIERPEVMQMALPECMHGRQDLSILASISRATQEATRLGFVTLKAQLLQRSFTEAGASIAAFADDPMLRILASEAAPELNKLNLADSTLSQSSIRKLVLIGRLWPYLPAGAAGKLEAMVPGLKLPAWWSMSADQIAQAIATGALAPESINPLDFIWIQASWREPANEVLVVAGRFDLLPCEAAVWDRLDLIALLRAAVRNRLAEKTVCARILKLPDARPVLAILSAPDGPAIKSLVSRSLRRGPRHPGNRSWIEWVINCLGTPEWSTNAALAGTGGRPAVAAMKMFQWGGSPIDTDGFRSALVDLLLLQGTGKAAMAGTMQELFSRDPLAVDLVATRMQPSRLKALLASPKLSLSVLDRFMSLVPDSLQETVWTNRLSKVTTAEVLRKVMLERAGVLGRIPWHDYWTKIEGTETERAVALILACRRDPKRLRSLSVQLGADLFAASIWRVAEILPASARRDRGYLELVGALGAHQIPYLSAVMAMADRSAAAGHKFDQAYRKYLLPKKSGGSRVISAPHPHLKRIQRAVLDGLLQPLGAHECAHGFVPGRSIRGNASNHVGQPIVTNADVRNCFPSVKWPLVLGVFRRELGHRLAPGAISLLVDICTADGGLPIGAPSSPALLNRVLLRTDEVLQSAAGRLHCRYSRYADDLTFSGDHGAVKLLGIAKRTLSQIGLELDPEKTNIYRRGRRQIVTGLVVNDGVSVPRRIRRRMRAAVRTVELGHPPQWHGKEESTAALMGRLAFVGAVNPAHAATLKARLVGALRQSS
jgi:retron-type reverse transcriptase